MESDVDIVDNVVFKNPVTDDIILHDNKYHFISHHLAFQYWNACSLFVKSIHWNVTAIL